MTRINLVDPAVLHDKHLLAEYRELPRVFGLVHKAQQKGLRPDVRWIPERYVLGKGHVTFFYDKLAWVGARFRSIVEECQRRGFSVKHTQLPHVVHELNAAWWNDYSPTASAIELNCQRIQERLPK